MGEKCKPTPNIRRMTPDLGELIGDILVGDEARCERPDEDSGDQVADQRRQLETVSHDAEAEGEHEAERDGGNERRDVRHKTDLQRGTRASISKTSGIHQGVA